MGQFERTRKEGSPRSGFSKRSSFGGSSRGGSSRGGFSDRKPRFGGRDGGRDRRSVEKTKVTCSSCGMECEVPFKPTSNKPVYCDACFSKKGKSNGSGVSKEEIDKINEKLDKIMKHLKIE